MYKKLILFLTSVFLLCCFSAGALSYTATERTSADLLAKLGIIVDKSANPSEYNLDNNVLRQEIAGVTASLSCTPKKTTCEGKFNDVSATRPNTWACNSVEALLDAGLIAKNDNFRPEANISKAESVGMVVKALYGSEYTFDDTKNGTWQQQVVLFAVNKGIVSDFTDYDAMATRGFIFEMSAKAISKTGAKCELWSNSSDPTEGAKPTTNNNNNNNNNTTKPTDTKNENNNSNNTVTCPEGYYVSGNSCYKITEDTSTSSSKKCDSITISGYNVPSISYGSQVEVQKTVQILLGTRQNSQKFECKNGEVIKVGEEVLGKATCNEGEKVDPSNPSLCYYPPSTGGSSSSVKPSCATYTAGNGTFTPNNPTAANTAWQTTTSSGACYVACDSGFTFDTAAVACKADCAAATVDGYAFPAAKHGVSETANQDKADAALFGTFTYTGIYKCMSGTFVKQSESITAVVSCDTNYSINSAAKTCVLTTRTENCAGTVPADATANTAGSVTTFDQTWNTTTNVYDNDVADYQTWTFLATNAGETCTFACDATFTWDPNTMTCMANTKTETCAGTIPANATQNSTAATYGQTWNASTHMYDNDVTDYQTWTFLDPNAGETCTFACDTNFSWDSSTSTCVATTKTEACGGTLPTNASANNGATFTQTFNTTTHIYEPATEVYTYNTTAGVCTFECDPTFNWDGAACNP